MGLDMWLYCNSRKVCESANDGSDQYELEESRNNVALYWRKANAIHAWMVAHVQGGEDNCGLYEVEPADLMKLLGACREVLGSTKLVEYGRTQKLADPAVAKALLPTQSGFFFGSTDYDQWYWWDIEFTANKLEQLTKDLVPFGANGAAHKDEPDWRVRFYYLSSW